MPVHAAEPPTRSHDAGVANVLVLAVVALAAVLMLAFGRLATEVLNDAAAQSAADAAALAGATGGPAAAARLAAANGATLVSFTTAGDDVMVTVEVDGRRASARATVSLGPTP